VSICSSILLAELMNFVLQPDPSTNVFKHNWCAWLLASVPAFVWRVRRVCVLAVPR
jgi:hypothetical protein